MSRQGLQVAHQYAASLPSFPDLASATRHLTISREKNLAAFLAVATLSANAPLDFSPDSLKRIELWYFDLYEKDSFASFGTDRVAFESGIAAYFGEVVVKNDQDARWIVEEYAFVKGRYDTGVRKGLRTLMLTTFRDLYRTTNNKKWQSLFRLYQKLFASDQIQKK